MLFGTDATIPKVLRLSIRGWGRIGMSLARMRNTRDRTVMGICHAKHATGIDAIHGRKAATSYEAH